MGKYIILINTLIFVIFGSLFYFCPVEARMDEHLLYNYMNGMLYRNNHILECNLYNDVLDKHECIGKISAIEEVLELLENGSFDFSYTIKK